MRFSISKIKAFKSCRRLYELKYIENMQPVNKPEALQIGSNYHEMIEALYAGADLINGEEYQGDYSKEHAMARAYMNHIYPKLPMVLAEQWLEYDLLDGDKLVGRVDGLCKDEAAIVEHKTYGGNDSPEAYEYNLQWDEQILAYMLLTGMRKVYYTVCRKPTIRQKKDETEEQFYYRMLDWYEDDTANKIWLMEITRTDEEVAEFEGELMLMVDDIRHTGHYYRNTCNCNMYGRRCEYSSICLHYDPNQEYVEYVKGEEYEPEEN